MNNDITVNRKILQWGWYKNSNTKDVFLHLLLTANWHDGEYMGQPILRGQCVFGLLQLGDSLGISVRSVRTALNHLKSTGEVTIRTTNKYSIATIVKYSDYQLSSYISDKQNDKQPDKPTTNERQTTDNIQISKSSKSLNNITPIAPKGATRTTYASRFVLFWQAYPKKTGKGAAEKSFTRQKVDDTLLQIILKAIEAQKQSEQWQKNGGQFIPNPATWLNQKRWEDEMPPPTSNEPDYSKSKDFFGD